MTWEEWAKAYPPKSVQEEPAVSYYVSKDNSLESRVDAELACENFEEMNDYACRVVLFNNKFYVVSVW